MFSHEKEIPSWPEKQLRSNSTPLPYLEIQLPLPLSPPTKATARDMLLCNYQESDKFVQTQVTTLLSPNIFYYHQLTAVIVE